MVRYWFARKYPVTGLVVNKIDLCDGDQQGTYLYTVDIMENDGRISAFDVHNGDRFNVLCEM